MNGHYRFGSAFVRGFKADGAEKLSTFKGNAAKIELHRNVNSLYCESTFVKQSVFGIKVQYVEGEC